MRKYFLSIPLIIFFFVILVFLYFLIIKRDPSELPSALINKKAPFFETKTLFNNETIVSSQILGPETTIVNFFATWCAPCLLEHPYIERLSNEKNIKVIGINYKDDSLKTIEWLKDLGNPYSEVILDLDGSIGMEWGVYGLPETFIVNNNSFITHKQVGPITKDTYNSFYQKIQESSKYEHQKN